MTVLDLVTNFTGGTPVSDTVSISSLSTLGSGSYSAPSTLVDNTPSGPHGYAYLNGLLRLSFSAALTAESGAPSITAFLLKAADGTNLASPPGTSAIAPMPNAKQVIAWLTASASFQVIDFPVFDLDPFKYGVQLLNNATSGAWTGTATLTLYRWGGLGS